ncbi:MAG: N-6 DNA methylase [Azoarcus sp. PHD]|nr:MAG: N-6 DNA methylase [Azoarcus sp. PHD]
MAKLDVTGLDPNQKEFVKLIRANAYRYRAHEVFRDFCELAALSISNSVDRIHYDRREARYLEIVKRYTHEEVNRFPAMLAELVGSLGCGFHDALGQLFMSLELGDHWKGQFFTPYEVAYLMAKMSLGDVRGLIERKGFFTLNEPAAGAGAMVIASAHAVHDQGINYQQAMHVIAQDIDATAVHMAYVQLALLHVPAIVVHGNSLAVTEWDHWATPAHVLGMWDYRLKRGQLAEVADLAEPESPQTPAPIEQARVAIVAQRIERTEQLSLFA